MAMRVRHLFDWFVERINHLICAACGACGHAVDVVRNS